MSATMAPGLWQRRRWLVLLWPAALTAWTPGAQAGPQIEEPLTDSVRSALSAAVTGVSPPQPVLSGAQEQQAHVLWLAQIGERLQRHMEHPVERQEFLQTLWYEARRAALPLSLVLAVVQIESAFRKFAVSSAGARGFMQVMPFWMRLLGDGDDSRLFHMQTNLRFGCVILRHYLERERGDVFMALGRYNGSRGQAAYPRAVLAAQRLWQHPVD